jgi:hypothetical protein
MDFRSLKSLAPDRGTGRYTGFLMQIFVVPAVVVHCHCALKAAPANGFGRVNLTDRKAATQASVRMAAMSAISWRVHNVQVMAFTPLALVEEQEKAFDRSVIDVTMQRIIWQSKL